MEFGLLVGPSEGNVKHERTEEQRILGSVREHREGNGVFPKNREIAKAEANSVRDLLECEGGVSGHSQSEWVPDQQKENKGLLRHDSLL